MAWATAALGSEDSQETDVADPEDPWALPLITIGT